MKALFFLFLLPLAAWGQDYDTVYIGRTTTVHLVFPSAVRLFDVGSGNGDILIKQSAPAMLKMASASDGFDTTNLFVDTENGTYNFILRYAPFPEKLVIRLSPENTLFTHDDAPADAEASPQRSGADMAAARILRNPSRAVYKTVRSQKAVFRVHEIYAAGGYIFFLLSAENEGTVKYDLGYTGFISSLKPKGKNAVVQTEELHPSCSAGTDKKSLSAGEKAYYVYGFDKFTLSRNKRLDIEFWETDGERKCVIPLTPSDILAAKPLPTWIKTE